MQEELISLLPITTERLVLKRTTREDIYLMMKLDKQEDTQRFLGGVKDKSIDERLFF